MWIPNSRIFVNYDEAYDHFIKMSPSLEDRYNLAEKFVNPDYNPDDISNDYIIIENRYQIYGHNSNHAKSPEGVVIARCKL
jgi:hypothetical protein